MASKEEVRRNDPQEEHWVRMICQRKQSKVACALCHISPHPPAAMEFTCKPAGMARAPCATLSGDFSTLQVPPQPHSFLPAQTPSPPGTLGSSALARSTLGCGSGLVGGLCACTPRCFPSPSAIRSACRRSPWLCALARHRNFSFQRHCVSSRSLSTFPGQRQMLFRVNFLLLGIQPPTKTMLAILFPV